MASIQKRHPALLIVFFFSIILIALGCASVQPPTGGPKDKTPPKVIRETPKNLSLNFSAKEIDIEFDEFIKLAQEFKEISISPSLNKLPSFKYKKNILTIRFPDSLEKNTTYTINFGKSIIDYNEGNILKNYSYVFSTGNVIDSLSISGNVVQSLNKKPEIEIPVFIIPTHQDSLFRKKPANIFTTTDSLGNFAFHNLKPDIYRIYALKEPGGGDRVYNSVTEEIAFQADSIALTKNVTSIKLQTFKEIPAVFSTIDRKISTDGRLFLTFNQAITKPSLIILNSKELDNQKETEFNAKGDTASLWIPDMSFDSISVAIQNNSIALDTVVLKRAKRDTYTKTLIVRDNLNFNELSQQTGLLVTLSAPATTFDLEKITILDDTTRIKNFKVLKDTSSVRRYKIDYPWKPGHGYTIRLADNTFTGPYGSNKYYTSSFKLSANDNFGNLTLAVTTPTPGDYLVQLLNDRESVIKTNKISGPDKIPYRNLPTGKYSVRVIYDINKNGKWDTGNVQQKKQPEPVWNSDKIISLRSNWDMDESLAIPASP